MVFLCTWHVYSLGIFYAQEHVAWHLVTSHPGQHVCMVVQSLTDEIHTTVHLIFR
jgi:hypothetical protein